MMGRLTRRWKDGPEGSTNTEVQQVVKINNTAVTSQAGGRQGGQTDPSLPLLSPPRQDILLPGHLLHHLLLRLVTLADLVPGGRSPPSPD